MVYMILGYILLLTIGGKYVKEKYPENEKLIEVIFVINAIHTLFMSIIILILDNKIMKIAGL
ncbi:hypothetical protein ACFLY1_00775 [Patescibacteria group bacterium]